MQSESSEEFLSSVVIARSPSRTSIRTRTTRREIGEIDRFESATNPLLFFHSRELFRSETSIPSRANEIRKYRGVSLSLSFSLSLSISREWLEAIGGSGDSEIRIYLEVELEKEKRPTAIGQILRINSILLLVASRLFFRFLLSSSLSSLTSPFPPPLLLPLFRETFSLSLGEKTRHSFQFPSIRVFSLSRVEEERNDLPTDTWIPFSSYS